MQEAEMSTRDEGKSKAAEDMKEELRARDEARREAERRGLKNLNQGMDASGHDAAHHGVNWGSSYRARRKTKSGAKGKK
jgi:hypothetical protein